MEEHYQYPPTAYDRLAANGVAPLDVDHALHHSRPRVREPIGDLLRVVARDRRGDWLIVVCIETDIDNVFDVRSARYADSLEIHVITDLLGDQP